MHPLGGFWFVHGSPRKSVGMSRSPSLLGAASAPLRCAGLRPATAALGSKRSGVYGAKELQESIRKSV